LMLKDVVGTNLVWKGQFLQKNKWVVVVNYHDALPKFLIRPTWGSKYVELRKVGTWGSLPTSSTKGGKRGVLEVLGLD
jgi:hypothetical protein